ncbi:hypothetical protein B0H19DRAFT_1072508 [Mycena capillaripes]|nr:hypothetical protein B0H19DRAFT_1072508 [Mycena capillaripes]
MSQYLSGIGDQIRTHSDEPCYLVRLVPSLLVVDGVAVLLNLIQWQEHPTYPARLLRVQIHTSGGNANGGGVGMVVHENRRLVCSANPAHDQTAKVTRIHWSSIEVTSVPKTRWPCRGLALLELGLTLLEIAGTLYTELALREAGPWIPPLVVSLTLSVLFRVATIRNSGGPMLRQRGESGFIILPRALVISFIGVAVPIVALYFIVVVPLKTPVYSRSITALFGDSLDSKVISGNATILLTPFRGGSNVEGTYIPEVRVTTWEGVDVPCPTTRTTLGHDSVVECPLEWYAVSNVSISLAIQGMNGVYVTPVEGGLSSELKNWITSAGYMGIPLFPRSRLLGVFTWTQRDLLNPLPSRWGISSWMSVFIPDVTGLQTVPANGTMEATGIATLTLFQQSMATFGGFWTFLNGAFALFFGANVLYFICGWRPLSALEVVHIFQRHRLIRQGHEDFPAIHTEGGLPGSESPGIVAFIRERLVDLGDEPRATKDQSDIEAQACKVVQMNEANDAASASFSVVATPEHSGMHPTSKYLAQSGYILDEIPLLDRRVRFQMEMPNSTTEGEQMSGNSSICRTQARYFAWQDHLAPTPALILNLGFTWVGKELIEILGII